MEIVWPINRTWIYATYFSLCRAFHPGGKGETCYEDLGKELETKTKTLVTWSRDQDQDLGHQVSRPRPRPWLPGLETKTKTLVPGLETKTTTLVIRSRGQDLISRHKYLCMCVYVCIHVCMLAFVYVAYVGRPIKIIIIIFI